MEASPQLLRRIVDRSQEAIDRLLARFGAQPNARSPVQLALVVIEERRFEVDPTTCRIVTVHHRGEDVTSLVKVAWGAWDSWGLPDDRLLLSFDYAGPTEFERKRLGKDLGRTLWSHPTQVDREFGVVFSWAE